MTTPTPLTAVTDAGQLAPAAAGALRRAVDEARAAGHSWAEIGAALGITRQAAFQRFAVEPQDAA